MADFKQNSNPDKARSFLLLLPSRLSHLAADAAACIRFFSRIPLEPVNGHDLPSAPPDFTRIARAMPIAGFAVALPAAGLGLFLGFSQLPALATATLVAGTLAIVTGALHEDGLGDVADGFFGGTTRSRRLEIMKDSRVGAFGSLAMVIATVLRVSLLAALWERFGPADAALLLLSVEAFSRTMIVWQWQKSALARSDGLAGRFGKPDRQAFHQALLVTVPLLAPAVWLLPTLSLLLACVVAMAAAQAIGRMADAKIGGMTGDVLGAIQQVSGLGFLVGMFMFT